mgnify:CR=1 FL=1
MAEQEVFDGIGVIQEKLEKISKKNKPYWKYKIAMDGDDLATIKTFNFFEYEAGSKVKAGDMVKLYWYENEGDAGYGDQLFRNVRSIFVVDKDGKPFKPSTNKTDEDTYDDTYDATHSTEDLHASEADNARSYGGGASSAYNRGARFGMMVNNAVQIAIAEKKTNNSDIKAIFERIKTLVEELEKEWNK